MKRALSFLLSILMVLSLLPVQAFAAEELPAETSAPMETVETVETEAAETTAAEETIPVETQPETAPAMEEVVFEYGTIERATLLVNGEELTNEDLFAGYVERVFYGEEKLNPHSTGSETAGSRLTGDEKKVYDLLLPIFKEIADGDRASAIIEVGPSSSEANMYFTDEEFDPFEAIKALQFDYPYETYWLYRMSCTRSYYGGSLYKVTYTFTVDKDFRGSNDYTANTAKTGAAIRAANNAKAIANKYAGKSDYAKLCGFRDEICALVDYDDDAADYGSEVVGYGPWQIIHTFDKDSTTNIVCGGYAKSFQYLCDLSGITCYYILGYMGGPDGYHAWNIVTLDGKNYHVDITNTDAGTWGQDGSLFMVGAKGSVNSGYTFYNTWGSSLGYTYDQVSIDTWGTKVLTLSSTSYVQCNHTYTSATTKQPTEYETGIRTYTCSKCGDKYTETIAKLPHYSHSYSKEETAATCTEKGYTTYTCKCGYSYKGDYTEPKGHTEVVDKYEEPTCQKTGKTEGKHCSVCKTVIVAQEILPIVDHKYINHKCKWCGIIGGKCGKNAIWRFDEATGKLTISGTGDMYDEFSAENFWGDYAVKIKTVEIKSGITSIGGSAFDGAANLTQVSIPNTVTKIRYNAFLECAKLTKINIPSSVKTIENCVFMDCTGLTDITGFAGVTTLGDSVFNGCTSLTEMTIPNTVTELGDMLFSGCTSLTKVTLPEGIDTIGENMFFDCGKLTQVNIPKSVTSIGNRAFYSCKSLTAPDFPNGLTTIGDSAFSGCTFKEINLPGELVEIGDRAFEYCESLMEITIPAKVEYLACSAFGNCSKLGTITFLGDAPYFDTNVFWFVTAVAYYPKDNDTWTSDVKQQYGGSITWVEQSDVFDEYSGICGDDLTWVYNTETATLTISGTGDMYDYDVGSPIPGTWEYYGTHPWADFARQIQYVVIENGATSLGDLAFYGCISLKQITIPASVQDMGMRTFYNCQRLQRADIPEGVKKLKYGLFDMCESLATVNIPDSVTWIDDSVFSFCSSLEEIDLPDAVTYLGSAVLNFTALKEITIPASIQMIGHWAFESCYDLKTITFQKDAPQIDEEAFRYVTANVYYPRENDTWTYDIRQDYGGDLTWVAASCSHKYANVAQKDPTCIGTGRKAGRACSLCGKVIAGCEIIPALGHDYTGVDYTYDAEYGFHDRACAVCGDVQSQKCTWETKVIRLPSGEDEGLIRHTCTVCGGYYEETFGTYYRVSGENRMKTAIHAAEVLKDILGVETFDTIIIASGKEFADALAGSYLAAMKNAPILLSGNSHEGNIAYIQENLSRGGTVYILGGTAAVPQELENRLAGYNVKRLAGSGRLDTNIKILQEAGITGDEILVATGWNFADSLSASATGLPILMVNSNSNKLTQIQKDFLDTQRGKKFTIIGGPGAVSETLEEQLRVYGEVDRVYGEGRDITSVKVAQRYFSAPKTAVLAYSKNFPDGLCGGPLAYALGAPLLLVREGKETAAANYTYSNGIDYGFVMGGTAAVSELCVWRIFYNS